MSHDPEDFIAVRSVPRSDPAIVYPQWEYKIVESVDLQGGHLNELGALGWELITVIPDRDGEYGRALYIFKSKKNEF